MACGLPVIATDVGGNREVVSSPDLGEIVPFDEAESLCVAIGNAIRHT
jgi:glycosyltransferase involved in cell wall biosynthesis